MFEGPSGSAARKNFTDAAFAVLLLAAPILFGYSVLAPDRIGLSAALPRASRGVVASIATPTPPAAPTEVVPAPPVSAPVATPSAIPRPVVVPTPRPGPTASIRPSLVPPPAITPPAKPDVPRVTWPSTVSGRVVDDEGKPLAGASIVVGGRAQPDAVGSQHGVAEQHREGEKQDCEARIDNVFACCGSGGPFEHFLLRQ